MCSTACFAGAGASVHAGAPFCPAVRIAFSNFSPKSARGEARHDINVPIEQSMIE
jgi:hypothetical protein